MIVERTTEYDRIAALPRRTLDLATAHEWSDALTPIFAIADDARLRPWQAQSLADAVQNRGAWLALPVGQGKTLLSWLLPTAMRSRRPLLIVPASLHQKTLDDFARYRDVWVASPAPLRIMTREWLQTEQAQHALDDYAPDLIVLDEADDLSNAEASAPCRVDRYVRTHDVAVVAMTGTPARKSLLGYWHQVCWCLGDAAPVPLNHDEARMWALALDDHNGARPGYGPLGVTLDEAREWYRRRLIETPGVVIVDEDSCDAPLRIRIVRARECPAISEAFERFACEYESPSGEPISDPLSRWLLDAQLGLGLYTRWSPAPCDRWRDARRAVARFVREQIAASRRTKRPLDTERQVLRRFADHPVVQEWREAKPLFDGSTETVWFSDATILDCLAWIVRQTVPSIVWCGSVDFGRALAARAALPYYGPRGLTDSGQSLHDAPVQTLVASWQANKKGFNLQSWTRQLIVMPPASAKWLEQIFGRSHRAGQDQPVDVDVLATSGGTIDAFHAAISEARTIRSTVTLTQKLLRADVVVEPRTPGGNVFRWAQKEG